MRDIILTDRFGGTLNTQTGKNLEYGLRQEGVLSFVRELNGNEEEQAYDSYLKDASLYARGTYLHWNQKPYSSQLSLISNPVCIRIGGDAALLL